MASLIWSCWWLPHNFYFLVQSSIGVFPLHFIFKTWIISLCCMWNIITLKRWILTSFFFFSFSARTSIYFVCLGEKGEEGKTGGGGEGILVGPKIFHPVPLFCFSPNRAENWRENAWGCFLRRSIEDFSRSIEKNLDWWKFKFFDRLKNHFPSPPFSFLLPLFLPPTIQSLSVEIGK